MRTMRVIVSSRTKLGIFSSRPIFFFRIRKRVEFEVKLINFSVQRVKYDFRFSQTGAKVFLNRI